LDLRACVICGKSFRPDPRARLQQKCCGPGCSKKLKRQRDKIHKKRYRLTAPGKEQRKRENKKQRQRIGWNEYMRFWRKAEPEKRLRQERERSSRYYQRHRQKILLELHQRRAQKSKAKNALQKSCSH